MGAKEPAGRVGGFDEAANFAELVVHGASLDAKPASGKGGPGGSSTASGLTQRGSPFSLSVPVVLGGYWGVFGDTSLTARSAQADVSLRNLRRMMCPIRCMKPESPTIVIVTIEAGAICHQRDNQNRARSRGNAKFALSLPKPLRMKPLDRKAHLPHVGRYAPSMRKGDLRP